MSTIVNNTASVGDGVSSARATGSNAMGRDQFLKLLMAQMSNQDPTSPTDGTQFTAQLAQFSALEAAQTTNQRLQDLLTAQVAGNETNATNLVGKTVTFKSDAVKLVSGERTAVSGMLASPASSVSAVITDSHGMVVRTLRGSSMPAGPLSMAWDGNDDGGSPLPAGDYTVKITAANAAGDNIDVPAQGRALVTGVSFSSGFPELLAGSQRLAMSSVIEVSQI